MQAGDLAKTDRPRPTWVKVMNQELIPSLSANIKVVGVLS